MKRTGHIDGALLRKGFNIIHIHRDRPPKVKFGVGYRFFTNEKFGNLALFGKLIVSGKVTIKEACEESGTERRRGYRMVCALREKIGELKCPCGRVMPHVGNCKGINGKGKVSL